MKKPDEDTSQKKKKSSNKKQPSLHSTSSAYLWVFVSPRIPNPASRKQVREPEVRYVIAAAAARCETRQGLKVRGLSLLAVSQSPSLPGTSVEYDSDRRKRACRYVIRSFSNHMVQCQQTATISAETSSDSSGEGVPTTPAANKSDKTDKKDKMRLETISSTANTDPLLLLDRNCGSR
jgi:hypothetical protein